MTSILKHVMGAAVVAGCLIASAASALPPPPTVMIDIPTGAAPDEAAAAKAMNSATTNADANTAMHMLTAAAAAHPDSAFAEYAEAVGFYRGADYDVARILVGKAIAADPRQASYYYLRGVARRYDPNVWNVYDSRNAIVDFKNTYTLDARFESAYRERGSATLYLSRLAPNTDSDYDGSDMADLAMAIQLDPNDPEAHFAEGIAYLAGGQWAAARDDLAKTVALGVTRSEVYENMGFADYKLGQNDQAAADYQKALDADPGNATARANLAALQGGGEVVWVPLTIEPWVVQIRDVQDKYYEQVGAANYNASGESGETNACVRDKNWWTDIHNGNFYLQQLIDLSRSDEDKADYAQRLTQSQATEATALQDWQDDNC